MAYSLSRPNFAANIQPMDVTTLTAFLAPCLPFLLGKVGAPALEEVASKLGEDTWEKAKEIWARLRPKVESEAAAKVASEKLATKPNSEAWKEAFQEELEAIFQKEPTLADEITEILQSLKPLGSSNHVQQRVETNQGQIIGQMYGGEVKKIGGIGTVQGDANL